MTQFSKLYTLTVTYSDAETAGLFEPGVKLAYWNGTAWINLLRHARGAASIQRTTASLCGSTTLLSLLCSVLQNAAYTCHLRHGNMLPAAPSKQAQLKFD